MVRGFVKPVQTARGCRRGLLFSRRSSVTEDVSVDYQAQLRKHARGGRSVRRGARPGPGSPARNTTTTCASLHNVNTQTADSNAVSDPGLPGGAGQSMRVIRASDNGRLHRGGRAAIKADRFSMRFGAVREKKLACRPGKTPLKPDRTGGSSRATRWRGHWGPGRVDDAWARRSVSGPPGGATKTPQGSWDATRRMLKRIAALRLEKPGKAHWEGGRSRAWVVAEGRAGLAHGATAGERETFGVFRANTQRRHASTARQRREPGALASRHRRRSFPARVGEPATSRGSKDFPGWCSASSIIRGTFGGWTGHHPVGGGRARKRVFVARFVRAKPARAALGTGPRLRCLERAFLIDALNKAGFAGHWTERGVSSGRKATLPASNVITVADPGPG